MPSENSLVDKFCCMAAIIAAIILLSMGFAEMNTYKRIRSSGTCGRQAQIENEKVSAKHALQGSVPVPEENEMVKENDTWQYTPPPPDNSTDAVKTEDYFGWEAPESVNAMFLQNAVNTKDILKSQNIRSNSNALFTQSQEPTYAKVTGLIQDLRETALSKTDANPGVYNRRKLQCKDPIPWGGTDIYASALEKALNDGDCKVD